jgi:hypothetical protein
VPEVKTPIQLPRRHDARQVRREAERFDLPPDTSDLLMKAVQAMRAKLLGIFESLQRGAVRNVSTFTETPHQIPPKELGFSVNVHTLATLGSYLAMSAPEPAGRRQGDHP